MILLIGICCLTATILLYTIDYLLRWWWNGKLVDKIPGPYAWPIIGNFAKLMVPHEELWDVMRSINHKYYPINRIWAVHVPVVSVYHPDDIEALLTDTNNIEKAPVYNFLHPWLGTGLLTSKGSKWHVRRKILTPAFHFNVLQQFVGIFIEQSERLAQSLCTDGGDEVVPDLVSLLHKYTVNTICETAMGFKSDVDGRVFDEYRSCVSIMGDIALYRATRPWAYMDWMFWFLKKCKEQARAIKVLHRFSTEIINERKRYHEDTDGQHLKGLGFDSSSSLYSFGDEHAEGRRRLAMLDLLISAQKQGANIDDEGIREEVDTFIFEGHDTTAMALCFTLLLLAENKEIQDKARAEFDTIFEDREGGKLSLKELKRLYYLERCIKESLRLFPSVPFVAREITKDMQLKHHLVPKGTIIHLFIREVHRDPNFWEDPDVFNPDRFLPDQSQGRHPFAYVPFSAGPRNCIGQKFAMLELKALVGTFLHHFHLEPIDLSSTVRLIPDLVLRPLNPIRIKLVRRSFTNYSRTLH